MPSRHAVARFASAASIATALATTTLTTPARADTHADAVKAFEEGRKLREGDPEKAALAFERSIQLEPSIGAYYNLGQMNEALDHPREAVDAFRKAEKLAIQKGDPRSKDAQEAWGKILDTHNFVVLSTSDDVRATPGLAIAVDGDPVPEAQYNGEVFRPTTTHDIVVHATGRKDLRLQGLPNKQPVTITLGVVASEPTPPPPMPPSPETASGGGWGWQKWTGVGLVAVGAAAVTYTLVGVISYAGRESARLDTAQNYHDNCKGDAGRFTSCMNSSGLIPADGDAAYQAYNANEQDAKDAAPIWIAVGAAGVLLIGGGLYLFASAPSSASERPEPAASTSARGGLRLQVIPRVGLHDTGLGVVGTF